MRAHKPSPSFSFATRHSANWTLLQFNTSSVWRYQGSLFAYPQNGVVAKADAGAEEWLRALDLLESVLVLEQ